MVIYPKLGHQLLYTPMTGEMKCPRLYLRCRWNTCANQSPNDMIYFISSRNRIGSSILTSLTLHHCFGPSAPCHHSTCPSHLQLVHRAKSCLDLLHLSHMTPCHVSYTISSFIITCVSFATSSGHFHPHGMCCINIGGDGLKCVRQRYNLGHLISPVIGM